MNNSFYVSRDVEASALKVSPTPGEVMKGIKESEVEEEVKKQDNAAASNISRKESELEKTN